MYTATTRAVRPAREIVETRSRSTHPARRLEVPATRPSGMSPVAASATIGAWGGHEASRRRPPEATATPAATVAAQPNNRRRLRSASVARSYRAATAIAPATPNPAATAMGAAGGMSGRWVQR